MTEKKMNLNSSDFSLLKAAQTGEGLIQLTPERMEQLKETLECRNEYIKETYPRLVEECPYETRLAITAQVIRAIVDHAKEGGSFRYLIYDRLGFGPDAYLPIYEAGGMDISNHFTLGEQNERERKKGTDD